MRRTRFDDAPCPIARTADLLGDWWTPIVMREAFLGRRRFDEFQQALGMSRGVLSQRLGRLVEEGLLDKHLYEERPPRFEYRLTEKGHAFYPVLAAMWRFGEDWMWDGDQAPPIQMIDRDTGEIVRPKVVDERTGKPVDPRRLRVVGRRGGARHD